MLDRLADEPTHSAHTPEQYRILLLERQVDHLLAFLGPSFGHQKIHAMQNGYHEQRGEFRMSCEQQPEIEMDEIDVIRETENALDQMILMYESPGFVATLPPGDPRGAVVHQVAKQARDRARRYLEAVRVAE